MKKSILLVGIMLVMLLAACKPAETGPVVLTVTGKVAEVKNFTMDDLEGLNEITATVTHPKKGEMSVTGVLLKSVLDAAKPAADATMIVFTASDGYASELELAPVLACADCMVGFADDGTLITAMPNFPGNAWAKMLVSIELK